MVYTLLIKATPFDAGAMVTAKLGHLPVSRRFIRTFEDEGERVETYCEVTVTDEAANDLVYEAVAGWFNGDVGEKPPFPYGSLLHFNFRESPITH